LPEHDLTAGPPALDSFSVSVDPTGTDVVLVVTGDIDMASGAQLRSHLQHAIGSGRRIVLDLEEVEFMDSTGLNAIVQTLHQARKADGDLVIRSASAPVRRLLDVSGVARFLPYDGGPPPPPS
jgi:anti-anti-sigma factor